MQRAIQSTSSLTVAGSKGGASCSTRATGVEPSWSAARSMVGKTIASARTMKASTVAKTMFVLLRNVIIGFLLGRPLGARRVGTPAYSPGKPAETLPKRTRNGEGRTKGGSKPAGGRVKGPFVSWPGRLGIRLRREN